MIRNQTAVSFYDLIDSWVGAGIQDFTEGIYFGNPQTSYLEAQRNQHNYLLDEVRCIGGTTVLDVGCGNGTLLEQVRKRHAQGMGITISPIQVERCRKKGLDVELYDYRDIGSEWSDLFDGIIANGSAEHFVSPTDALKGKQDQIYREMFSKFHSILGNSGRLATTVIHFNRIPLPEVASSNPLFHKFGSDEMHYAFVLGNLGCFYPHFGQLEKCARGYFTLEKEVDGTEDYRITSEYWLNRLWPSCLASGNFWQSLLKNGKKDPKHTASALFQYVVTQSWNWQFRPDKKGETPTKLLRQTWKRID